MFATPNHIVVLLIILTAGTSIPTNSAIAMTWDQARAECLKELGMKGGRAAMNAGGGLAADGTTGQGSHNSSFARWDACVQQKLTSQDRK
jgi:hypothetical protein